MGHWSWRKKKNKKKKENVPQNEVVQEAESVTGEPTMALRNLSHEERTRSMGDSPEKVFIDGLEEDYSKAMNKAYVFGAILLVVGLIFIAYNLLSSPNNTSSQKHAQTIQTKTSAYTEPERSDKLEVEGGSEQVEQKNREMDAFNNSESVRNNRPDLIALKGGYYYMFNDAILLPLDNKEWVQYDNTTRTAGYGAISAYLPVNETQSNWTHKIIAHHLVSNGNFNCFEFTDKLVNGIIVNIQNQLEVDGSDFDIVNGLAFNYVRKDANDTLLYWGLNVPNNIPQVQFVRCFVSEFTKEPYLITYTIKTDGTAMNDEQIQEALRTLDSAQELKKKG